jgi:hypothetical protein
VLVWLARHEITPINSFDRRILGERTAILHKPLEDGYSRVTLLPSFPVECRSRLFTPRLRFVEQLTEQMNAESVLGTIRVNTT